MSALGATSVLRTIGLLFGSAWRRGRNRAHHQAQLRAKRGGLDWTAIAGIGALSIGAATQLLALSLLSRAPILIQRFSVEATGRMAVSPDCLNRMAQMEEDRQAAWYRERYGVGEVTDHTLAGVFYAQGRRFQRLDAAAYEQGLIAQYRKLGRAGFAVVRDRDGFALRGERPSAPQSVFMSGLALIWFAMLVAAGDVNDLDFQGRRDPMWEWLMSHPVDVRAACFAEMLSPLAANPALWVAPLFWVGAFWSAYDSAGVGLGAGLAAGIPLTIAAGCVGKAIENAMMLRLAPYARGAVLGTLAALGQGASLVLLAMVVSSSLLWKVSEATAQLRLHVPVFEWLLGMSTRSSPWLGVVHACLASAGLIGAAALSCAVANSCSNSGVTAARSSRSSSSR